VKTDDAHEFLDGVAHVGFEIAITVVAPEEKILAVAEKLAEAVRAAKVFSKGKQALVDMAKADKAAGGITRGDMKAYKELNEGLPDPFPADKVRGPETHPLRTPQSKPGPGQLPHGHVGPIDHIPITD
jgi:hypothetical protein